MIAVIIILILVLYFIGKYISASNKDKNNPNTAQFGEKLAGLAKNTGCVIILFVIVILVIGAIIVFQSLFGGYTS